MPESRNRKDSLVRIRTRCTTDLRRHHPQEQVVRHSQFLRISIRFSKHHSIGSSGVTFAEKLDESKMFEKGLFQVFRTGIHSRISYSIGL
jgi:hypothetical protein